MSEEEIHKALEIIREPIVVNCKDYYYFDQENYNKLISVYENARWFVSNFEQVLQNIEQFQQENQQLKEQLENASKNYTKYIQQRDNVLDEIREYIKELDDNTDDTTCYDIDKNVREDLLQILDKVKENER